MEDIVVGVNKYRLSNINNNNNNINNGNNNGSNNSNNPSTSDSSDANGAVNVLSIDNTAVRESQLKGLRAYKANRDNAAVKIALDNLTHAAKASADGDVVTNKHLNLLKASMILILHMMVTLFE